jgi:hypothetical protein
MKLLNVYQTDDIEWTALVTSSSKPSRQIILIHLAEHFAPVDISNMRIKRRKVLADVGDWWMMHLIVALITGGLSIIYLAGLYIYEAYNPLWEVTFDVNCAV